LKISVKRSSFSLRISLISEGSDAEETAVVFIVAEGTTEILLEGNGRISPRYIPEKKRAAAEKKAPISD
jgi:hypothetical protein